MMSAFNGAIVRGACEKIYGGKVDPHAWLRWKKWAGVPRGRTATYTADQFCLLIGIAALRKNDRYGELSMKAVKKIAYADDTICMVDALAEHVRNEGWALGWDVRSALAVRGYEVSGAMLKKLMPSMRPNGWYQVDAVIKMIEQNVEYA